MNCFWSDTNDIQNIFLCLLCTWWFQYLLHKFKRHSKFHLNSRPIKNLLTIVSGYLAKFSNFYPQSNLETVFTALKLTQIFCVNMNNSFFENWHFNQKFAPPLLITYQAWKSILPIWQKKKWKWGKVKNSDLPTL